MRGTTAAEALAGLGEEISIHVPREGHDVTAERDAAIEDLEISIHVPREGHDQKEETLPTLAKNFYPRAP